MNSVDFDVEALAEETAKMLEVASGQVIWIWASGYSINFIEALAFRIRARGAFWTLRFNSESLQRRIGMDVPQQNLASIPEHELRWLDDIDAIVEVRDHAGNLPGVSLERRRALGAEWIALIDAAARKKVRKVTMINPTPALAEAYNLPLEELCSRLMRALNVDYQAMDSLQERLAHLLEKTDEVQATSAAGTNLRLRVRGRKAWCDTHSLPRGETYIAPLEDSADGVAVIDKAFLRGRPVQQLRLTFAGGRVVAAEAPDPSGAASFKELLEASSGDRDRIAELGIGTNPGVTEPIGNIALDEKIGGSIHLAVGMNESFGGMN